MDDKFNSLLQLAANTNREIEYSVERVVVKPSSQAAAAPAPEQGDDIVEPEAARVPVLTPADLAGGSTVTPIANRSPGP